MDMGNRPYNNDTVQILKSGIMKLRYIIFSSVAFMLVIAVAGAIYLVKINTYRVKTAVSNRLEDTIEKKVSINPKPQLKP